MIALVICRGLPASGKTTMARGWVEQDSENRARVNRDDLRFLMFGVYWGLTHWQEEAVTAAQHGAIRGLLKGGIDVICDDTNLRLAHARALAKVAVECGATWSAVDFPTDPDICVERDRARQFRGERCVGEPVIRGMAERFALTAQRFLEPLTLEEADGADSFTYVPDPGLPPAWLVDIDGTLALMHNRGPFDWARVGEDLVNEAVRDIVWGLETRASIVLLSGRDEVCRPQTEAWLADQEIEYDGLFMRPAGDNRKDAILKLELFREHVAPRWAVQGVIDDRRQVVEMWRSIGLTCAQVADGDF